jgi:DNA-binding MarR family transcriptional regulator/N-acetylglutamate synthase-like GNAT family acetyltransferase
MTKDLPHRIAEVREFNRFYTRLIGVLSEDHLSSPFSLAQVRVLYELAHQRAPAASELCEQLALDPGYLSRMLRELQRKGLVTSRRSTEDARRWHLELTAKGRRVFGELGRKADAAIAALLEPVPIAEQREVTRAMQRIRAAFEPSTAASPTPAHAAASASAPASAASPSAAPPEPYLLRSHQPGDMGWVVHRHGALYAEEYGWDERFEAMVARITADFIDHFDPKHERCWIAERDGAIVGSVFLVKKSKTVGQLRMLYVEPAARGLGLGRRLVAECTRVARQARYRKIVLWTNSVLLSARRIYQAEGYRLVEESPDEMLKPGLSQIWELVL